MNARNFNPIAVALCAALAAPLASAQLVDRPQVDRLRDRVERQEARQAEVETDTTTKAAAHSDVAQREAWARIDVDADGRISLEEAEADEMLGDMFGAVDADGDGFVSDAEYRAHAHAGHVAEASAQGAANAAAHSAAAMRGTWSELDGDGDGRISAVEAEVDVGFHTTFGDMDADGDGFVSDAEYRAKAKADLDPPR